MFNFTPTASPSPLIADLDWVSRRPSHMDAGSGRAIGYNSPSTAARPIHQISQVADSSRGFRHWFTLVTPLRLLLAGTGRLVVPARPYIVRAAPSLTPNPGISLPSASTSCCDSQRRASQPAQSSAPPGAHPIESTFATVRLRTKVTKGAGSRRAALAMAYKLVDAAQARWRRIDGYHLTALVRAGAIFIDGQLQERVKS